MASFTKAIYWIARNHGADDNDSQTAWEQAAQTLRGQPTVRLVADLFGKDLEAVVSEVLRARGIIKPRVRR